MTDPTLKNTEFLIEALGQRAEELGITLDVLINLLGITIPTYEPIVTGKLNDAPVEVKSALMKIYTVLGIYAANPAKLTGMTAAEMNAWSMAHISECDQIRTELANRWQNAMVARTTDLEKGMERARIVSLAGVAILALIISLWYDKTWPDYIGLVALIALLFGLIGGAAWIFQADELKAHRRRLERLI